jgi:hypothetical protein
MLRRQTIADRRFGKYERRLRWPQQPRQDRCTCYDSDAAAKDAPVSCQAMRRLARHLFALCSAVSLVLCVAVCVLWVRSVDRLEAIGRNEIHASTAGAPGGARQFWELRSEEGKIALDLGTSQAFASPARFPSPGYYVQRRLIGPGGWQGVVRAIGEGLLGFQLFHATYNVPRGSPAQYHVTRAGAALPDGVLAVLLLVLPWRDLVARRRARQRARKGQCVACG